jgi:hypothetical protein
MILRKPLFTPEKSIKTTAIFSPEKEVATMPNAMLEQLKKRQQDIKEKIRLRKLN